MKNNILNKTNMYINYHFNTIQIIVKNVNEKEKT